MIGLKGSQLCWLFFLYLRMEIGLAWALRSPIGKKKGQWATTPPEHLMGLLMQEAAQKFTLPEHVVLATATTTGGNAARVACLQGNLPQSIPAFTLDAQCLGSAQALLVASAQIQAEQARVVWVGGMESASLLPIRGFHPLDPRYSPQHPHYQTALFTPSDHHQPMTERMAPLLAEFDPLALQDWGMISKERAWKTQSEGNLASILYPSGVDEWITKPKSRGEWYEIMKRFKQSAMHPLNCAPEADGAALLGLTSAPAPILLKGGKSVASHPDRAALAYLEAVDWLLNHFHLRPQSIDFWEIHEAFAMKPVAAIKKWGINPEKVNIFGGNLAYGHPFGASGAIGVMHLREALLQHKARRGIFAMSAAGGQGIAILVEYQG